MTITIKISDFKKYFKYRYVILCCFFIILPYLAAYIFPFDENYNPTFSIKSEGPYGHSIMYEHLKQDYNITQQITDFETISPDKNTLLIIQAPQRDFRSSEILHLKTLRNQFTNILLIGSQYTRNIANEFGFYFDSNSGGRIFDEVNNFDETPAFVKISYKNEDYYAITPRSIFSSGDEIITTYNTAETAVCIEIIGVNCEEQFTIGASLDNLIFISDEWIFSNYLLEIVPGNLKLLDGLINSYGTIDTIIFNEIHYKWLPINRNGLENFIFEFLTPASIFLVVGILTTLIPGLFIFSTTRKEEKTKEYYHDKSMKSRLQALNVERIVAVPLSLEENVLVQENLEFSIRKDFYFSYVANDIIKYIEINNIRSLFPDELFQLLQRLTSDLATPTSAWSIIKNSNEVLDKIIFEKGENT
jgi:hypothetical protein